ncbi:antigen-presenting glycoprotein CD1d-like [Arvicola amphibius]|uniref:antigen-presenting glycoprotein CD1d-like n=1 Tax=Arvicola amphibius TaxID=1047088 RepID=UPI001C09CF89|nr:antigen-presenting glycoprotein CD1d-like [Arvicola amphibius]
MLSLNYPIEIQLSAGCDLYSENASENFLYAAYQGEYILSFQGTSFQKAPDAPPWTELVIKVLSGDPGTTETAQRLLYDICPKFVHGLQEAGNPELEREEKPVAWLSSGLSPKHGHLQLVCHVSGFYPKPVWVMWMQGEQEQNSPQRSDCLPDADETWYLRATLDVEAGKEAGLACCVKHSSLGGQDITLYRVRGGGTTPAASLSRQLYLVWGQQPLTSQGQPLLCTRGEQPLAPRPATPPDLTHLDPQLLPSVECNHSFTMLQLLS